jgi:uncharacterized delta-60 repeat protein
VQKLLLISIACLLAVGAMTPAAAAHARLDRSYGQNGYVEVRPPLPAPWRNQYVRHLAAARDGDGFALVERQRCAGAEGCSSSDNLFRYLEDGSLDPQFGGPGGSYELPHEGEGIPALAVDSGGQPLLARASADDVVVRRLTLSGAPDPSFGEGGAVKLECDCEYGETQLVPGREGVVTVVLPRGRFGRTSIGYGRSGTIFTLIRLEADGSLDRGFGEGGSSTFGLRGVEPPIAFATSRHGALYLSGAGCCGSHLAGYVVRVSARGTLDRRFTTASGHALRVVEGLGSLEESVNAVIARPGGKIDLLGSSGYERGFLLRLNPNGRPHRRFGRHGLRVLPVPVASATLGSDSTTLAVSDESVQGGGLLARILPGGRPDPAFGQMGTPIAGSLGDYGFSVVRQVGRRALVLDLGEAECRAYCAPDPKFARFLEGPPTRRR